MTESSRVLRLGLAQMTVTRAPAQNLASALEWIARAGERGVELLCLPEYCLDPRLDAQRSDEEAHLRIREACQRTGLWCVFGAASVNEGTRNSCFLVDPRGELRHRYDKVHLWRDERAVFTPGARAAVVDIGVCRLGILCCWDMAFPRFVGALAREGAELILCPAYLCDATRDAEALRALPAARAFENVVFFAVCDALSPETLGESVICHPQRTLARLSGREGLLVAELQLDELAQLRSYYGDLPEALEDRPPMSSAGFEPATNG
ncbi:MAG: carbon-nitrogen hydrolase family protein, partial [Myxococcales bacterium]|nr:carbon-nitrogen hydrolase family protein [Myxococcales bacterium]